MSGEADAADDDRCPACQCVEAEGRERRGLHEDTHADGVADDERRRHAEPELAIAAHRAPPWCTSRPSLMTPDTRRIRSMFFEWVALDGDQVGELARRDRAELLGAAERGGGADGRGADRVQRGHAVLDHVGELACVVAVRVDAGVGAEADPHARLDRLGEVGALRVRRLAVLAHDFLGPAVARADLFRVVAVVDVGDQPGAVLDHERDALVVEVRAVLDGPHAGANRVLDALGAVGVGSDERAALRRFLDRRADFLLGVLRRGRRRAGGRTPRRSR